MKSRGRKSSDAQSPVVSLVPGIRPDPPPELTSEQAAEWKAIVGRMPVAWFMREAQPLLNQLVRHICLARLVAKMLDEVDAAALQDVKQLRRFERLESMHEKEGRAIGALMRSLRLTNRSRYDAAQAHVAAHSVRQGPRPWETDNDDAS
jgi:hypothetical protein